MDPALHPDFEQRPESIAPKNLRPIFPPLAKTNDLVMFFGSTMTETLVFVMFLARLLQTLLFLSYFPLPSNYSLTFCVIVAGFVRSLAAGPCGTCV